MQMCYRELERLCDGFAKKASEAGAPGTSALSETFMSKTSCYVSSAVASRMKCKLRPESVGDSVIMRGRAVFRGRQQHLCCLH